MPLLHQQVVDKQGESGWVIRDRLDGPILATFATKREALERAEETLRSRGGGELLALNSRSQRFETRLVAPRADILSVAPAPAARGPSTFVKTIEHEGDSINDWLGVIFPLGSLFGVAVIAPKVAEADHWLVAFLATLAWSLGWVFAVYLLREGAIKGAMVAVPIALGFVASILIAKALGVGELNVPMPRIWSPSALTNWLLDVTVAAVATYGWLGALGGGLIGGWLGDRVHEHFGPQAAASRSL